MSDPQVNNYCPGCGRMINPGEAHVCRFAFDRDRPSVRDFDRLPVERNLVTSGMEAHHEAIKSMDRAAADAAVSPSYPPMSLIGAASAGQQLQSPVIDEARTRAMIATVLQVEMHGIRQAINDMTHDIQANSAIVKTMDVPLEQVHQSHERAAISFENLQKDMDKLGNRLAGVEQVIDTAGLKKAQDGAEARFTRMLAVMERLVGEIVRLHGETLERARVELERNEARRANIHIPQKPHPKRKHR